MRSRYEILIVMLITSVPELLWYQARADQQASTDEGIDFAKTLVNGVQNLTGNITANSIPGYGGSNLPETDYYDNQDLSGMQTDAIVGINNGTANEVSQYAYQQSLLPKLQFGANDLILTHSDTISTDAMTNPDVLTVQTGSCGVANVTTPVTQTETCTSWITPTVHTCNNTLDVDVTWDSLSSCPVGTSFSEVETIINKTGKDDYVYARAYCNPGSGDDEVDLQVWASDTPDNSDDCTGWTGFTVSTNQPTEIYTGVKLRPRFTSSCKQVPTFIQGGCTDNDCDYTITYHYLTAWGYSDGERYCWSNATPTDLSSKGFTANVSGLAAYYTHPITGDYCSWKSASLNVTFEKPNITQVPTVTDSWNDSCGPWEAQVQ
jgi:hypothetical protein